MRSCSMRRMVLPAALLPAVVLLVCIAAPLWAADAASAGDKPLVDYRQITLDNGLRVITLEDFSCPIVNVQVWYHVGSKDENPERQGFAHMFEHMMFRGTERLGPTDHMDLIRRAGGECNAYTSFDQTVYHETLTAHQLELALWLEAERMSALKIDQSSFDTERKVVEEERRMGLNRPFGTLFEQVMAEVFHEHPYRWTPIGKIPHLRASAVGELRQFWNRFYVPNNATLVIAGAVKHAEAQQLVRRHFGWIPRGEDPGRVEVVEAPLGAARQITVKESNAPAPIVGVLFRTVPLSHPDHTPLEMLAKVLVGDNSSRLYRALVVEKKLAVQAIDISQSLEQDGIFFAGAVLSPFGGKPEEAMLALEEQVEKLRTAPISDHELTKSRNQMLKEAVTETLTVEGKASVLARAAVLEGDAARANERLAAIRRVTLADLTRVAQNYLTPAGQIGVTVPASGRPGAAAAGQRNAEEDAPITAEPEKQAPPAGRPGVKRPEGFFPAAPLAAALDVPPPSFEHSTQTLANGLKVLVVPNHEVPFVSVQLGLLNGAWTEEKPGTAAMALDLISKGTKQHDEAALADELGTYAISLSGSGGMDSCSVVASCLSEQLDRALGLLGEVVLTPTFPQSEFADLQQQTLTGLQVQSASPEYMARRELRRRLYGAHPYARSAAGEVDDVRQLRVEELAAWWNTNARPDQAVLIFAGDVDRARAVKLAEATLGGWKAPGQPVERLLPAPPASASTQFYLVNKPGSTQSQVVAGQLAITRHNPEYFSSLVVNGYFGGAFSSRLNESIRVQKGLTYGARGGFAAQRFAGTFNVSTFTKTETTADTLDAVLAEVRRLRDAGPSTAELDNTKAFLTGNFPLERETPQQVAGELWLIELNGLPTDYFDRELAAFARATAEDCRRVVRDHVHPDRLVVVIVGNAEAVKESLEKLGPVTVVEADK